MLISDWISDVCSSDLRAHRYLGALGCLVRRAGALGIDVLEHPVIAHERHRGRRHAAVLRRPVAIFDHPPRQRSEEHTSELQSLMRISYAVFCLKKKNNNHYTYLMTHAHAALYPT